MVLPLLINRYGPMLIRPASVFLFSAIGGLLLTLDLGTKRWVEAHLPLGHLPQPLLQGVLNLTHQSNPGVAFSFLAGQSPQLILVAGALLIGLLVIVWLKSGPSAHPMRHWGYLLALSGALGNWVDRLLDGQVTDYLQFAFWPGFPVMNLADWYLSVGMLLLAVELFRAPLPSQEAQ